MYFQLMMNINGGKHPHLYSTAWYHYILLRMFVQCLWRKWSLSVHNNTLGALPLIPRHFLLVQKMDKTTPLGAVPKSFAKRDIKLTEVTHPHIT